MSRVDSIDELFNNQALELRRGTVVLATLGALHTSQYGYQLLQKLEKSGLAVDAGTLYPLMRRLEKQGLLESRWDTSDSRPRKYYQASAQGKELYNRLISEWRTLNNTLEKMITERDTL